MTEAPDPLHSPPDPQGFAGTPGLDPAAARVLELMRMAGRPPVETLTPDQAREAYRAGRAVLSPDPPPVALVRDLAIPGPAGAIPARLYRGAGTTEAALPVLLYLHGGGWVIGDLDTHDVPCRTLANLAGCAVLSVAYRLAPEHRFPAAVEDGWAALRWLADGDAAARLGLDPARIAVGGDSAGGNLAAVLALMARDAGGPALALQLLVYPATDFAGTHPSRERNSAIPPIPRPTMAWFQAQYLARAEQAADWRASPLHAPDVAGTAPALVVTAGFDPLQDEGAAYAARLEQAGVPVDRRDFPGQIHGFLTMGRVVPDAAILLDAAAAALREAFGG